MCARGSLAVVGLSLVAVGGVCAAGFDGTAVTLADDTSMRVRLNVPAGELREAITAGGFERPPGLIDGPGLRVQYFDHDLLVLMPVEERLEVEIAGKPFHVMAVLVLLNRPADFEHSWPLVWEARPAAHYVVAHELQGQPMGFVVTPTTPHRAEAIPTRLPEWGQVPGATVGQGEVHPYETQMGRGCVFGVGLVVGDRIVACDLVR